jgi:NAD(P)H-flavin reductase
VTTKPDDTIARVLDVTRVSRRAALVRLDFGRRAFPFAAGQAISIGLATQHVRKPYSMASAPAHARRDRCLDLLVGVSEDGRLGAHLEPLSAGSVIGIRGPSGRFALPPYRFGRSLLFVAGGTGIAPLRSMLHAALGRLRPTAIDLVYSARTPDDLVFDEELRGLRTQGRIRYWPTVTRRAGAAWRGRRGRVDAALLREVLRPMPICLVCGPAGFVTSVTGMLLAEGVRKTNVRREEY